MLMQQMQHIRKPPHIKWIQWKHTKCCHHAREYMQMQIQMQKICSCFTSGQVCLSHYNVQCGVCRPIFGCICLTFLQCVFSILQHAGLMVICSSTVWLCGAHLVSASQALWSVPQPSFLLVVNVVILNVRNAFSGECVECNQGGTEAGNVQRWPSVHARPAHTWLPHTNTQIHRQLIQMMMRGRSSKWCLWGGAHQQNQGPKLLVFCQQVLICADGGWCAFSPSLIVIVCCKIVMKAPIGFNCDGSKNSFALLVDF